MEITYQGKNKNLINCSILRTNIKDKNDNLYWIDTCYLNPVGAMFDMMLEGHNTTGEIEMMVALNEKWLNFTQRRYKTEKEAIKDHKKIVKMIMNGKLKEIKGSSFGAKEFGEDIKSVDKLLKVKSK